MKRNDALVVMNPRRIEPVMRALDELDIPQIRIIGHTEREIADLAFPVVVEMEYDWLWVVSDDAIVRPAALAAVRSLMRKHPVVTGYSQRSHDDFTVNLTDEPLSEPHPSAGAYSFLQLADVVSHPAAAFRTWFTGMSLTGMSRTMWQKYPFDCYGTPGYASDFSLSYRLQEAGVPIMVAREAFAYHWRADWVTTNNDGDQSPCFDDKRIEVV